MQVLGLEASLSAVHNERSQNDMGLKSRMQELLSELQSTLQVWPSLCKSTQQLVLLPLLQLLAGKVYDFEARSADECDLVLRFQQLTP